MRTHVKAMLLLIATSAGAARAGEIEGKAIAADSVTPCFVDWAENLTQPEPLPDDDKPIINFEGTVRDERGGVVAVLASLSVASSGSPVDFTPASGHSWR